MDLNAELERRHANVRAAMAEHDLDALVVSGSEYTGFEGAVTYLSGFQIVHRYAYVVVPAEGDARIVYPAEARYELPHLVERYTRFALEPDAPAAKGQLDLDGTQADPTASAGRQALAVHQLAVPMLTSLGEQGMADLYRDIENPLVRVLARMEHAGIAVDVADLRALNQRLTADVQRLGLELKVINLTTIWEGAKKVRPNTFELWFGDAPLPTVCGGSAQPVKTQ